MLPFFSSKPRFGASLPPRTERDANAAAVPRMNIIIA